MFIHGNPQGLVIQVQGRSIEVVPYKASLLRICSHGSVRNFMLSSIVLLTCCLSGQRPVVQRIFCIFRYIPTA